MNFSQCALVIPPPSLTAPRENCIIPIRKKTIIEATSNLNILGFCLFSIYFSTIGEIINTIKNHRVVFTKSAPKTNTLNIKTTLLFDAYLSKYKKAGATKYLKLTNTPKTDSELV